ncbi:MAG: hypothetical protein WCG47_17720 [Dermatophilaceae bacterium]
MPIGMLPTVRAALPLQHINHRRNTGTTEFLINHRIRCSMWNSVLSAGAGTAAAIAFGAMHRPP